MKLIITRSLTIGVILLLSMTYSFAQRFTMPVPIYPYYMGEEINIDRYMQLAIDVNNGTNGYKRDDKMALILFKYAADKGYTVAYSYVETIAELNEDYELALHYLTKEVENGNPSAINRLAYYYAEGKAVEKNFPHAHKLIDGLIDNENVDNSEKGNYYGSKGEFYLLEGDRDRAKQMLDKALSLNPDVAKDKMVLYQEFYDKDYEAVLAERKAESAKLAAEAKAAEEARLAAEEKAAEEARLAAEAKAAEEAKLAAEEVKLASEAKSTTAPPQKEAVKNQESKEESLQVDTPSKKSVSYPLTPIYRKGSKLYNTATGTLLTSSDLSNPSLWQEYEKSSQLMKAGNILYIAGGVSFVGLFGTGILLASNGNGGSGMAMAGLIVGPTCLVTGAILRLTGKSKLNQIVKSSDGQVLGTVSIGTQPNGIGLAFVF